MGRSVSYPSGAVVAFRELDDDADEWAYDDLCDEVREAAIAAWPSLQPHQGWRGREDRILLRNAFADLGVSVYGGVVAVWIAEREDGGYYDADALTCRSARAQRWLTQIAPRFRAMFGELEHLGRMSNGEAVYRCREAA